MKTTIALKYGKKNDYWKVNILTGVLQILLFPFAAVVQLLIVVLAIALDFLQMGSHHIEIRMTPKDIIMPDGTIRKTPKKH